MSLPIITIPSPILRRKSHPVDPLDPKIRQFITSLEETLTQKKNPPGVGLSAPQIGKNWRIFATFLPEQSVADRSDLKGKKSTLKTYINPQIVSASKKLTLGPHKKEPILEGCLSIPGIYGPVLRHEWIKLRFVPGNLGNSGNQVNGKRKSTQPPQLPQLPNPLPEKTQVFSGFTARVIQHELDHLDGILFTDRSLQQKQPLYEEKDGKFIQIDLN